MKKIFLILTIALMSSCKAQTEKVKGLSEDDYEVLSVFLSKMDFGTYLDKNFIQQDLLSKFKQKYEYQVNFFKNADSICRTSKDNSQIKFYCPLADEFKKYDGVLSATDFNYMSSNHIGNNTKMLIDLDRIEPNLMRLHTEEFYERVDYENISTIELDEFPSIRIYAIYYTEDRQTAVVAYSTFVSYQSDGTGYFILSKQRDIWWKPIGGLNL